MVVSLVCAICAAQAAAHREFRGALLALAGSLCCGAVTMFAYALPISESSTDTGHLALVTGSASMWLMLVSVSLLLLERKNLRWTMFVGAATLFGHLLVSDYLGRRTWNTVSQLTCAVTAIYIVLSARRDISRFSRYLAVSLFAVFCLSLLPRVVMHFNALFFAHDASLPGHFAEVSVWRALVWTVSSVLAYAVIMAFVFSLMSHRLKRQIDTDFLTGLGSRSRIFDVGNAWFRHPNKNGAVLLIDVDHFKKINDTYGHQTGDEVLKHCADRMKEVVRKADSVVARYGGEEFCVLLPETDLGAAQTVGERIRASIGSRPITVGGQEVVVTVSVGLAVRDHGVSLTGLLAWADKCLYEAKAQGRNCVVAGAPPMVPAGGFL